MIEDLVELIKCEFVGVICYGGVLWIEVDVIDIGGVFDIFELVKMIDIELNWIDLILDFNWKIFEWSFNWSFLDDIGFCYYLLVVMCCELICEELMINFY